MLVKVGDTTIDVRVEAVLSMPRLSFTANHTAWQQALLPLGIRPTFGTGVFWSQVNTRIMESFVDQCEYLLMIDYDTFFTRSDVEQLFATAMTFQCDALAALQTKREDGRPMLTLKGTLDNPPESGSTAVDGAWLAEPVQEVDTAHFGCTVISTAALKRAKLPWFASKPGPDNRWNEGRTDEDIYFWRNWRDSGNKIYVSPRICIGHGEYMITWPGKDLQKPVYQYTTTFNETGKRPDSAWSLPT